MCHIIRYINRFCFVTLFISAFTDEWVAQEQEEQRGTVYCCTERKAERGDLDASDEGGKRRGKFNIVSELSDGRKTEQEKTVGEDTEI